MVIEMEEKEKKGFWGVWEEIRRLAEKYGFELHAWSAEGTNYRVEKITIYLKRMSEEQ